MDTTKPAGVYVSNDNTRELGEPFCFAEVIIDAGYPHEQVLHTTGFHARAGAAIGDARRWMKKNGVTERTL